MREILFRGISLDTQKWIEGYGVIVMPETKESFIIHRQGQNLHQHTEIIPSTVGQFTGLTDKNGTNIFEGDVDQYGGIVVYDTLARFCIDYGHKVSLTYTESTFEITSNIHDK